MARRMGMGAWLSLAVCGCATTAEPPAAQPPEPTPVAAPESAPAPTAAAPPQTPSQPAPEALVSAPPPEEIDYPFKHLATIPDDCSEPSTVLTTAPTKVGWDYDWMWTRQALFANPQFKIVEAPAKPEKPMQIRLDMYEIPGGFALVAVCRDGATCNKLAAMYKSTVPTCSPKLHCGAVPIPGKPRASRLVPQGGAWLPLEDANVVGKCARLGVCLSIKHEKNGKNPGVECQNAPAKFKVDCAKKATCDEVVECLH